MTYEVKQKLNDEVVRVFSSTELQSQIAALKKKLVRLGDGGAKGKKAQATRWQNEIYRIERMLNN